MTEQEGNKWLLENGKDKNLKVILMWPDFQASEPQRYFLIDQSKDDEILVDFGRGLSKESLIKHFEQEKKVKQKSMTKTKQRGTSNDNSFSM